MENRYEKFSYLISNINKNLQKIKNMEMKELGLKGKAVQIIYYLSQNQNGLSFTQLSAYCDEDKGALSRTLKELTGLGYATVEEREGKYRNPIKLTEKGKKIGQEVAFRIERYLNYGSQGIEDKQREEFYILLERIANNLQNAVKGMGE